MSQSASLYPITPSEFELLNAETELSQLPDVSDRAEVFDQNFEGLYFMLAKFFEGKDLALINEIFSPTEFVGGDIDYTNIDFDDDLDGETEPLFYIAPVKVSAINSLLQTVDDDKYQSLYDSDELNGNEIYPSVWHNDESFDKAFNKRHLEEGLRYLKQFFSDAAANGNYVFSFVG